MRSLRVGSFALVLALGCATPAGDGDGSTSSESESVGPESGTDSLETETETETETGTGETEGDPPRPARLLATADWRAKRVSLIDYAALRDGAETRDAALWKSLELPDHEPGPLEVELTPDGSMAVIASSPGFFAGSGAGLVGLTEELPVGGGLLIVDIESETIVAELETAQYPMGIAIAPDGSTAWTANYGGNGQSGVTVSVIDLGSFTITEELEVGPGPEQIDLSADGSLGIVNIASNGAIRTFETSNPSATLSADVVVSDDPSWVLFLDDGMDRAVAINSLGPPGYSLLDVADPSLPVVLDTVAVAGVAYAVAPGRSLDEILLAVFTGISISLQLFDVDTGEVVELIEAPVTGLPLGIAFDPTHELALVPAPASKALIVADFTSGEHRAIDWQDQPGPTYVTLE